jgi:predicted ATPase
MKASSNSRFVPTGGPGGGKTTVIEELSARGYRCVPEVARAIIKTRIDAGQSPRPDPKDFAKMIFDSDVQNYRATSSTEVTFFDRGIVDALGMLAESAAIPPSEIEENLRRYSYNKTVFLLPPWEAIYRTDDERDQAFAEAVQVSESVSSWYSRCGYELLEVPFGTVAERVDFILSAVAKESKAG